VRRDPEGFDQAVDIVGTWSREERREGARILLQALAERRIGRRDQAQAWLWRLAEYSREVHEEYAVQRWPETKRLLGLLVNSSGPAHGRNARRLVHAARKHDRRLAAALLAAALAHTPEAEEVLRGARNRMARKPSALARELVRSMLPNQRSISWVAAGTNLLDSGCSIVTTRTSGTYSMARPSRSSQNQVDLSSPVSSLMRPRRQ